MYLQPAQVKKSDDNEDKKKLESEKPPSISIRTKIAVSYSLFFLLCIAITLWSFWIISILNDKVEFLVITDDYLSAIQQARRFEKNYLLYGTNLDDAFEALDRAKKILSHNKKTIKKIMGEKNFHIKFEYMSNYWDQLVKLKNSKDSQSISLIVPNLREYGGKMVAFAQEFVNKERNSVAYMFLLAKRVPLLFISILLILVLIFVILFTRQLMVNLKRVMNYTKRIGEGDFSPIVSKSKYRDEFSMIADAFNRMTKELDYRHNIILESHKLRAVGTLVAGVAHELNNPLNNTMLTAEVLKEDFEILQDNEKIEMINDIIDEAERSRIIVKGLLDFARESEANIKPLEIAEIVNNSVRLVANQVKLAKVRLELDFDENLPRIHGDEQMLKQVFVNLILNAVDALYPGGTVRISIHKNKIPNFIVIEVKDNGSGIPEHIQSRIFEPFFTTKEQSKGTGLGLSVSKGIIRKLGGYIHLESSSDAGTTFTVSLPVTDSPSEIMSKQSSQENSRFVDA
jgi:signal transduction histidine kinase